MGRSLGVCRTATRCKNVAVARSWLHILCSSSNGERVRKCTKAQTCEQVEREAENFYTTCRLDPRAKAARESLSRKPQFPEDSKRRVFSERGKDGDE